jgi:hypothetical protein
VKGFHVYFRSAAVPDRVANYADGELRGGNGYVVLPPSEHPAGGHYEWVIPPGDDIPEVEDPEAVGLVGPAPAALPEPETVPPEVEEAIAKTLPAGPGQRSNRMFLFVRRLKAIRGLDTTYAGLLPLIREWHRQALPNIKTKSFEETEETFFTAWGHATTPLADDQFRQVVNRALAAPDPDWYPRLLLADGARKLLKVCVALQEFHGGKEFYLSARKAAEVINVDPALANRLLTSLAKEGYVLVNKKGTLAAGEATTWACTGKEA